MKLQIDLGVVMCNYFVLLVQVPATPAEAKVKEKLPIPQEFEVMVQLFEAMLARCRTADSTLVCSFIF